MQRQVKYVILGRKTSCYIYAWTYSPPRKVVTENVGTFSNRLVSLLIPFFMYMPYFMLEKDSEEKCF